VLSITAIVSEEIFPVFMVFGTRKRHPLKVSRGKNHSISSAISSHCGRLGASRGRPPEREAGRTLLIGLRESLGGGGGDTGKRSIRTFVGRAQK